MKNFKEELLKTKLVSVWGAGYLGYTKLIKLQSRGFKANVFDFTKTRFDEKVKKGEYPDKEQIYSWSANGDIPVLDASKINIIRKPSQMFDSCVHIVAFSAVDRKGNNALKELAGIFVKNKRRLNGKLIIFQSAGTPGTIDKHFVTPLKKNGCNCDFVSAFRSDWAIEDYFARNEKRILAADSEGSMNKAQFFYSLLGIKFKTLATIKEAELYENAKNTFQYMTTVFINQLSFAYPDTNVRGMVKYLLNDVELNESHLCIGAGGSKIPISVESIAEGSKKPQFLSLIKESQESNMSLILNYAEAIKKIGCKSVTIMGLTVRGNQKSIDLSPSVAIAEYLNKLGIDVYIDDPLYDKKTIQKLLPFSRHVDLVKEGLKSQAVLLMTDHNRYKYFTQKDIDSLGIRNALLVIDNVALFRDFKFSPKTVYHLVGDGKMGNIK